MPSIADHWVRLTDQHLALIIDGPPEPEQNMDADEYIELLVAWGERIADVVEDGLETW